jgi:hypothetical protein
VGGKWEPVRWQDVKPNDMIRVYERGMLSDGINAKVLAPCDVIEIEDNYYANILTDQGEINSKGVFSPYSTLRNPSKKKHRARMKKITPGG